jgi:hypothetical protein
MIRIVLSSCVALLLLLGNSAHAQWSTIKGKFTVVGDVPVPVKLTCNKDVKTCCAKPELSPVDESVVVSKKNELANVFVYAVSVKKIDPTLKKDLQPVVIDNLNCVFKPHAAVMWTEQKLELRNSDDVGHNSNFNSPTQGFNPLIPIKGLHEQSFEKEEKLPRNISCSIHPWMQSWLLVRSNPYATVSAADGTFEIKNVPNDEEIEYVLWQEKAGYLANIVVPGGKTDVKGRFKLKAAKDIDLGELKVDAKENLKL